MAEAERKVRRTIRATTRAATATLAISLGLAGAAGTALAAGNGYGGAPVLPSGGVPGGFRKVVTAAPAGPKGRAVSGYTGKVHGRVVIPKGAAPHGEQVVVTKPRLRTIKRSAFRFLRRKLRHDHLIYGLGIVLQRRGHRVRNRKLATLTLTSKRLTRKDHLVVYSPRRHGFVPAPRHHVRLGRHRLWFRFVSSTELAVLGP